MQPIFLQRCLRHKIEAKHKRRIQMTVCLKKIITNGKSVFPMYVCLARRVTDRGISTDRVVYHIGRIFVFRGDVDLNSAVQVKFTLPEMNKLAKEAISDTIDLLFLSAATVEDSNLSDGASSNLPPLDLNHRPSGEYEMIFEPTTRTLDP
ncbi:hypothetical protein DEO72_LG9g465 [Vigna unguiculata]|uniref:DUF7651 domain-containing protein n=1 Tax=Vigna unguiculata TaxID=3917 RepID=A0A4D6MXT7_VIGUN|nr:hypothetical protein DEO72_LG9g465 [Vigna unguiculata]